MILALALALAQQQAGPHDCQVLVAPPSPVIGPGHIRRVQPTSLRLALETDYEFYQLFGNEQAARNYALGLVAAVSDLYCSQIGVSLQVVYLGIHADANDPWTATDAYNRLLEFQAAWGSTAGSDLAHMLSGAQLGGGVAYIDVLCNPAYGFGVSGNLTGMIDWSAWTGASGTNTWDFIVLAHELGHNFGSLHTHDYCPPPDRCWPSTSFGGCNPFQVCSRGTLMSYCHQCTGGLSNIDLWFAGVNVDVMQGRLASSCVSGLGCVQ